MTKVTPALRNVRPTYAGLRNSPRKPRGQQGWARAQIRTAVEALHRDGAPLDALTNSQMPAVARGGCVSGSGSSMARFRGRDLSSGIFPAFWPRFSPAEIKINQVNQDGSLARQMTGEAMRRKSNINQTNQSLNDVARWQKSRIWPENQRLRLPGENWRHLAGIGGDWRDLAVAHRRRRRQLVIPAQQAWGCHVRH
jgi:hypothetical protein